MTLTFRRLGGILKLWHILYISVKWRQNIHIFSKFLFQVKCYLSMERESKKHTGNNEGETSRAFATNRLLTKANLLWIQSVESISHFFLLVVKALRDTWQLSIDTKIAKICVLWTFRSKIHHGLLAELQERISRGCRFSLFFAS